MILCEAINSFCLPLVPSIPGSATNNHGVSQHLTLLVLVLSASIGAETPAVAMAILFAVVARGTTILAKHAWCGGNFLEVTEQILAKIPSENNKLTYSHGR